MSEPSRKNLRRRFIRLGVAAATVTVADALLAACDDPTQTAVNPLSGVRATLDAFGNRTTVTATATVAPAASAVATTTAAPTTTTAATTAPETVPTQDAATVAAPTTQAAATTPAEVAQNPQWTVVGKDPVPQWLLDQHGDPVKVLVSPDGKTVLALFKDHVLWSGGDRPMPLESSANPLKGKQMWARSAGSFYDLAQTDASIATQFADQLREARAVWIVSIDGSIKDDITAQLSTAPAGVVPMVTLFNYKSRNDPAAEAAFIKGACEGIGPDREVVIFLEPDFVPNAIGTADSKTVFATTKASVTTIKTLCPKAKVFIDAGHSSWKSPSETVQALIDSGIEMADGFSCNISNFRPNDEIAAWANQVIAGLEARGIHGKVYAVDTARNGGNVDASQQFNAPKAAFGHGTSTVVPNSMGKDCVLMSWIKPLGESDSEKARAVTDKGTDAVPGPGELYVTYAKEMLQNTPPTLAVDIAPTRNGDGAYVLNSKAEIESYGAAVPLSVTPTSLRAGDVATSIKTTAEGGVVVGLQRGSNAMQIVVHPDHTQELITPTADLTPTLEPSFA